MTKTGTLGYFGSINLYGLHRSCFKNKIYIKQYTRTCKYQETMAGLFWELFICVKYFGNSRETYFFSKIDTVSLNRLELFIIIFNFLY